MFRILVAPQKEKGRDEKQNTKAKKAQPPPPQQNCERVDDKPSPRPPPPRPPRSGFQNIKLASNPPPQLPSTPPPKRQCTALLNSLPLYPTPPSFSCSSHSDPLIAGNKQIKTSPALPVPSLFPEGVEDGSQKREAELKPKRTPFAAFFLCIFLWPPVYPSITVPVPRYDCFLFFINDCLPDSFVLPSLD